MTPHQQVMHDLSLIFTVGGLALCFVSGLLSGLLKRRREPTRLSVGESASGRQSTVNKRL